MVDRDLDFFDRRGPSCRISVAFVALDSGRRGRGRAPHLAKTSSRALEASARPAPAFLDALRAFHEALVEPGAPFTFIGGVAVIARGGHRIER
jgi:hypothetical protein